MAYLVNLIFLVPLVMDHILAISINRGPFLLVLEGCLLVLAGCHDDYILALQVLL